MMAFILAPLLVTLATSISNTEYIVFPPRGLTLQWYGKALRNQDFLTAMWFSTGLALAIRELRPDSTCHSKRNALENFRILSVECCARPA